MPISSTYEVKPGDTLTSIAQKHGLTLARLLAVNEQITNPNLIIVGQRLAIPTAAPSTPVPGAVYDGVTPAPGTIQPNAARLVFPPLTNGLGKRAAASYAQVIDQFAVGRNPRYRPRNGDTFCNIFLWDVTRAMNCEIPHWVDAQGDPAAPFHPGANEMNVNGTVRWLREHGVPRFGWQLANATTAQAHANEGKPAFAIWRNPTGGHGHTAIIRPGLFSDRRGATTAQAGSINFNHGHIRDGFHTRGPKYYIHD